MKTEMLKQPRNIRKGLKLFGLFAIVLTALFVSVGIDTYAGIYTTAAVAVPGILGTEATEENAPGLLQPSISPEITEMYASRAPLVNILRQSKTAKMVGQNGTGSYRHEFYGADFRPVTTTVMANYTVPSTPTIKAAIKVNNVKMFTKNDIIEPLFSAPTATQKGYDYSTGTEVQKGSLQLAVVDVDYGSDEIYVQPINGKRTIITNITSSTVPAIPANTTIVRLGCALAELDAQTAPYEDLPENEFNFIQTFAAQFEVTPEMLESYKKVGWDLTKIKNRTMREFLESQERAIVFGQRSIFEDTVSNSKKYTMGGLLYYMTNHFDYTLGTFDKVAYSDMMKQLFANNSGLSTRYMFMGSGFAGQLNVMHETKKISDKVTPVQKFGMSFNGFSDVFGTVNTVLHPMLDLAGRPNDAFVVDFTNLALVHWGGLQINDLDLAKSGQRNVIANFMKEKLTLEVNYPSTHMYIRAN